MFGRKYKIQNQILKNKIQEQKSGLNYLASELTKSYKKCDKLLDENLKLKDYQTKIEEILKDLKYCLLICEFLAIPEMTKFISIIIEKSIRKWIQF